MSSLFERAQHEIEFFRLCLVRKLRGNEKKILLSVVDLTKNSKKAKMATFI